MNNHIQLFIEFYIFGLDFKKGIVPDYNDNHDMKLINDLVESMQYRDFQYLTDLNK